MTEIAAIIEALFAADRRKAISYMKLFVEKNYPPPALPVHKRTDEQEIAHRLKMMLDGKVEDNYTCLGNRFLPEIITITEFPIEELLDSWRSDPAREQS